MTRTTGLVALEDADALETQNVGTVSKANDLPPALKAAYVRARKAFQNAAASASPAAAADLAKWVAERAKITAQTASLTREGTAAGGWR
jgi:hypothetical protein